MTLLGANPLEDPASFDKIRILMGNERVTNPGLFRLLDGKGREYKWQINDPAGAQGAIMIYRGWKITDGIKFRFEFWEKEQIDDYYRTIDPLLSYDARKFSPKPIEVYHPVLALLEVSRIIVKRKGPLVDLGGQLWSAEVDVAEFRPPPKLNVTSTPDSPRERVPKPMDAQDREIARLLEVARQPLPPNPNL